jgi:4'-phosphopantetheinyl transferase
MAATVVPVSSAARVSVAAAHVDDLAPRHLDLLDVPERARWERLERDADRGRFVLGAVLLRSVVADLEGGEPSAVSLDRTCPRCGEQHGPVTTPGRPWRCSVAHSGPYAVVAVARADAAPLIGVDVETRCPPDWRDLLPRVVAPGETPPEDERGFLAAWVRKEAVLKSTGDGLSRPPSSVRLLARDAGTWGVDAATDLTVIDLTLPAGPVEGHAALAVAAPRVDVVWRQVAL